MWVFDNEIASILGTFENGDIVNIHDFDGYFMGYGYINTNSKITLRLLARRKDTVIDEAFFEQRVRDAWNYRKETIDTSSCRLIFGEADFLPGIVIDKFSEFVRVIMINFLNDIRNAENPISNNRKLINTIAILFLGIALGTFSKYLDFRQTELPGVLMAINGVLDIGNFLGRFAIWILIALCISIYSNSAIRASINVFVFFVGMVASYYLHLLECLH